MKLKIALIISLLATTSVMAQNETYKVIDGKCSVGEIDDFLVSNRYSGEQICEGYSNPSIQLDSCLRGLGGGDWNDGVVEIKKRHKLNLWLAGVQVFNTSSNLKLNAKINCKSRIAELNKAIANPKNTLINSPNLNGFTRKISYKNNVLSIE